MPAPDAPAATPVLRKLNAARRRATPRWAVRMWLSSPAHRAIVLDSGFRFAGVGEARGRFRGRWATVWVVRFAGG